MPNSAHAKLQSMKRRLGWATLAPQLARLTEANVPLAFWTGYKEIVLVSSQYAGAWSVVIEQDEQKCVRVFPRRWLDITGRVMSEVWTAACRAVVGTIVFHPNISQVRVGVLVYRCSRLTALVLGGAAVALTRCLR